MVWRFLKKLNIELPCDPVIPRLVYREMKTRTSKDTLFAAVLFIIAKKGKEIKCTSAGEWVDKWGLATRWNIIWP